MIEAESVVSIGFSGVEDSDREGAMVMESARMGSSTAGVAIGGEGIGAKGRMLVIVMEDRVMDLKIERVVNFSESFYT